MYSNSDSTTRNTHELRHSLFLEHLARRCLGKRKEPSKTLSTPNSVFSDACTGTETGLASLGEDKVQTPSAMHGYHFPCATHRWKADYQGAAQTLSLVFRSKRRDGMRAAGQ
jgi:hypothetical protein